MSTANVDSWKSIIDKMSKSSEIKGRVSALVEVGDLITKRHEEAKNNPEITLDTVADEVMLLITTSGLTNIMEKVNLDREVDIEVRALIAANANGS